MAEIPTFVTLPQSSAALPEILDLDDGLRERIDGARKPANIGIHVELVEIAFGGSERGMQLSGQERSLSMSRWPQFVFHKTDVQTTQREPGQA